ncbi:2-oxoglutarate and iron-dependent oxygenase JMJD4-like [Ornithodoros turicata]|uniref:2-oxoglutarate and iron-dependent oxygenase JMJD4-like n=1 Tax=Ornithodoros turicata TaxID=34597 RepID=UPI003138FA1C
MALCALSAAVEKCTQNYSSFAIEKARKTETMISQIDVVETTEKYEEFFKRYLLANRPCKISSIATRDWKSSRWVDSHGKPDLQYIRETFGLAVAPVADCSIKSYNSQLKSDMTVADFVSYWEKVMKNGHDYSETPCLYLKDWHLVKDFPVYHAYNTPTFFTSDWLNEFWMQRTDLNDDYRFVYMGPKGSWTPFHADVYGSFSWSANVCGRKLWYIFCPGDEKYLEDKLGNLAYDITSPDLHNSAEFPNAYKLRNSDGSLGITTVQEPGEAIFVPSGWHHQVYNLEDTISINHNWFNGCNIDLVWRKLWHAHHDVEEEISELRGSENWHEQCEIILRAHHGLNVSEFCWLLEVIAKTRLRLLESEDFESGNDPTCSKWHVLFDLVQVLATWRKMLTDAEEILSVVDFNRDIVGEIVSTLNSHSSTEFSCLFDS